MSSAFRAAPAPPTEISAAPYLNPRMFELHTETCSCYECKGGISWPVSEKILSFLFYELKLNFFPLDKCQAGVIQFHISRLQGEKIVAINLASYIEEVCSVSDFLAGCVTD